LEAIGLERPKREEDEEGELAWLRKPGGLNLRHALKMLRNSLRSDKVCPAMKSVHTFTYTCVMSH
jgi:hypothetical protein